MEAITLNQCLRGAWRDAGRAMRSMPALFIVAFVLVLASSIAGNQMQAVVADPAGVSLAPMSASAIAGAHGPALLNGLASMGIALLQALVIAALAVQVIRFTMLSDVVLPDAVPKPPMRLWDAGFLRYFLLCVLLVVGYVAVAITVLLVWAIAKFSGLDSGTTFAATLTMAVLVLCGTSYVSARLALLFPFAAAGGRLQWRAAWQDSRGHFWFISMAAVVTLLPVVAIAIVFAVIAEMTTSSSVTGDVSVVMLVLQSVVTLLYTATTATCSVWLYRKFAAALKEMA
jgi:hypothetical protein